MNISIDEKTDQITGKVAEALVATIERHGGFYAKRENLGPERTEQLKEIVFMIIKTMEVSVMANAATNHFPIHLLFAITLESISAWNHEIDKICAEVRAQQEQSSKN